MSRPTNESGGRTDVPLDAPELYFNHRISWMRFNERVRELALDDRHPLLERLRLLAITATNLDEFVEVRIPDLEEDRREGVDAVGPDGRSPRELLEELDELIADFVDRQYDAWEEIRAELADERIHLRRPGDWSDDQREWAAHYFEYEIGPVLSHERISPDRPFPKVLNEAMNVLVEVGGDRPDESGRFVVVRIPESLPAVVRFPPGDARGTYEFALVSDVVVEHLGDRFAGEIRGAVPFRVTRASDVDVDPDDVEDLRGALEDELMARPFGEPVRLEVPSSAAEGLVDRLVEWLGVGDRFFRVDGPVDLGRLDEMLDTVDRPDLAYEPFVSGRPEPPRDDPIFEAMRDEGFVIHRPYEDFRCFVDFVERAADDPRTVAIKQTVYRTLPDSPVVDALARAARAGKDVTVVVELTARFDEEKNVELTDRLRDAGATVVFGPDDHKVHAKTALVVRREDDTDYRYAHLGTGNYHPDMARQYTDLGYFTADRRITADVAALFEALERDEVPSQLDAMLVAPTSLHRGVVRRIEREIAHAHLGKSTGIAAKMNRLTEPAVIRALYRASRAGVEVDLIVRGMCRLRPGVEGVSENIRVRSILGRFLEHSRAFYFENDGYPEIWVTSADWREKNMHRRVEQAARVVEGHVAKRIRREIFETYLADDTHAWHLHPDGRYRRPDEVAGEPRWAQRELTRRRKHPDA